MMITSHHITTLAIICTIKGKITTILQSKEKQSKAKENIIHNL